MPSLVHAVFFTPSFNVLSGYFCFVNIYRQLLLFEFYKFRGTPPLACDWLGKFARNLFNQSSAQRSNTKIINKPINQRSVVEGCFLFCDGTIINQRNASWFHKRSYYLRRPTFCKHVPSIHNHRKSYSAQGLLIAKDEIFCCCFCCFVLSPSETWLKFRSVSYI